MPTFNFYKGGKLLEQIVGADIVKVERMVKTLGTSASLGSGRVLGSGKAVSATGTSDDKTQLYILYGLVGAFVVYYFYSVAN